ncbi:putative zinc-binding metallopeptidase [Poriferisphaera sp. WC338]|uniref:putative zinc-binding metallopeptidase n=1 Tax=Poriferisphaera sp. WC338 TaxID=3425129 RepID=UPI003D819D87
MPKARRQISRSKQPYWANWPDSDILDLRFRDLNLSLNCVPKLQKCIDRLYVELEAKNLTRLRPHCWLSTEWFSPDGIPGIALPFYLAHPRLAKLEKKQVLYVEGRTEAECMKILRHEAGHCFCTAYRLHYRKLWRKHFGSYTDPYPDSYKPKPNSQKYVQHLDYWYAQAHPAEDFAETFAVWLKPGSRWKHRYQNWPAINKLNFVNDLMTEIVGRPAPVRSKKQIEPLNEINKTLREHYTEKRLAIAEEWPEFFDTDLQKLFSNEPAFHNRKTAAAFLREFSPELRNTVSKWTAAHPYTIDQVLRDMIDRCKELKLRCRQSDNLTRTQAVIMLTVQTMNYIHAGHYRVPL